MDPLSVTASIVAILQLTVKIGEALSDAKDASNDRSQFTADTSNLSNLLVALLSRLDESSDDPWHANVRELGGKDGLIFQYRIALERLTDKISASHGLNKTAKTLLWKYIRDDAERILLRIERLKSLVQIALELDHFKLSQAIKSCVRSLQDDNKTIRAGVGAIQQDQDRQRHRLIMDWLSSDDFEAQHADLIARRQANTGVWFLDSSEFTEWIHGASQTLFCPGIPGAGKTMMAAIAVDHLLNTVQTADVGVAYLYCNYKRQVEHTTPNLLAAVLKQLVQDRPSIAQPLSGLYDHHQVRRTRLSLEETVSALRSVLGNYSKVYVVIDALDECPERDGTRSQLLKLCRSLQGQTDLRLMATSRHISDIVAEFKDMPQVEVRASNADVKRYVEGKIDRLAKCVQRDRDLQELVQYRIVEAVDGMFLLARLHVDSLIDKITKAKVKSALSNLSKGSRALDDAYDEAIFRIDGQPLNHQLCHTLAVGVADEELDADNIPDIEDILSVCAGLVTVDEESQVIRLVHYTTQDYLEGIREKWNPNAQQDIASTCLTYLCFEPFRRGSCPSDAEFESRLEEHKFLDYAARYWHQHVATVQEETSELAMVLLQDSNLIACALQTTSISTYKYTQYSQSFPKQATGLHLVVSLGLLHLSTELLFWFESEKVIFVDAKDSSGSTPLIWAASNGHKDTVELLLGTGKVDVDAKNSRGWTPLMSAAFNGHKDTVELLLGTGKVDVDAKNSSGSTPHELAARNKHKETCEVLRILQTAAEALKKQRVRGVFSSVASYNSINDFMSLGIHRLWKDHFVRNLNPGRNPLTSPSIPDEQKGWNILDIAGGTGDIAFPMLDHASHINNDAHANVTVADINPDMLAEGKKRSLQTPYAWSPRLRFDEANAENLDMIPDTLIDLCIVAFGIRNFTHKDVALKDAYRVLKPGGVFACLEFSKAENPLFNAIY
ncbi:hypothetical protein E8E12_000410 [Didymella heteroderae]|uniref:Nephrocystin 3-like N-terminal domain-containing protein n=1 Tax=Didymella heteroderae TaxID=1769908 RepID=A0A9P4WFR6_9PLEO|nr:hypothetical protein E8E12_000410 [Didymella heteroderae]